MMNEFLHIDTTETKFPSPSRGSYFSIVYGDVCECGSKSCFRPLHGDLISQYGNVEIRGFEKQGFRPLHGDLISQWILKREITVKTEVSVPFPGILFLNGYLGYVSEEKSYSFRPLPGDLISQ